MANKTIPELTEIDLEDVADDQLLILDTGLETFKVRMDTIGSFFFNQLRKAIELEWDGTETGEITVDVSAYVPDAQLVHWLLKKPLGSPTYGKQMPATEIWATDAETVIINLGDFTSTDAGTYILLGV